MIRAGAYLASLIGLIILGAGAPLHHVHAHGLGRWGFHPLEWQHDQIDQTSVHGGAGRHVRVAGKDCIAGPTVSFDVRSDYAFDIDETVWLDIELRTDAPGATLNVRYDSSDGTSLIAEKLPPAGARDSLYKKSVALKRARFANLGFMGTDFSVSGSSDATQSKDITVCSLSLRRSYTTPIPTVFGWAAIKVVDEKDRPTPARMGLYDAAGRMPLPSDDAVVLRTLAGASRAIVINTDMPPWPVRNRSVFYTDGGYHTRLPAGEYRLIVAKGPEYRLAEQRIIVTDGQIQSIKIKLRRWTDMAAKGWYSGEDHLHYERESPHDDRQLQLFAQAEDLRVSNILHMGNVSKTWFGQYAWEPVVTGGDQPFVIVPGQEDPRTAHRGHTIQLNIRDPVRNPAHYLLYHEVFEKVRAQGGLTGYAHLSVETESVNATTGLAMDVPFGLVDFAEILHPSTTPDPGWFDFLNLGYKLTPTAGTDYPYAQVPAGAARNYVKIDKLFTPQAWFDALKEGRTFVSNGPMLELRINGRDMGADIEVNKGASLTIEAKASINPDLDTLSSLELIEQGDIVRTVPGNSEGSDISLRHEILATHGTWFVLRARGRNSQVRALSAPIYVRVDGQSFWKPTAVPAIVAALKLKMRALLEQSRHSESPDENDWDSREPLTRNWKALSGPLKARVDQANARYDDLVERAAAGK